MGVTAKALPPMRWYLPIVRPQDQGSVPRRRHSKTPAPLTEAQAFRVFIRDVGRPGLEPGTVSSMRDKSRRPPHGQARSLSNDVTKIFSNFLYHGLSR